MQHRSFLPLRSKRPEFSMLWLNGDVKPRTYRLLDEHLCSLRRGGCVVDLRLHRLHVLLHRRRLLHVRLQQQTRVKVLWQTCLLQQEQKHTRGSSTFEAHLLHDLLRLAGVDVLHLHSLHLLRLTHGLSARVHHHLQESIKSSNFAPRQTAGFGLSFTQNRKPAVSTFLKCHDTLYCLSHEPSTANQKALRARGQGQTSFNTCLQVSR